MDRTASSSQREVIDELRRYWRRLKYIEETMRVGYRVEHGATVEILVLNGRSVTGWVGRLRASLRVQGESSCARDRNQRQPVSGMVFAADLARNDAQLVTNSLAFLNGGYIWHRIALAYPVYTHTH